MCLCVYHEQICQTLLTKPDRPAVVPRSTFGRDFAPFINHALFSDVTLHAGDSGSESESTAIRAHKYALCLRLSYFRTMFFGSEIVRSCFPNCCFLICYCCQVSFEERDKRDVSFPDMQPDILHGLV